MHDRGLDFSYVALCRQKIFSVKNRVSGEITMTPSVLIASAQHTYFAKYHNDVLK